MEVEIFAIFIPLTLIIGVCWMVVYLRRFENAERMAMIEKGVSAELLTRKKRPSNSSAPLRASLLLIGAGIGILLGYFLDYSWDTEAVGYLSMLFIFGGLGLGLAYVIEEKKAKTEKAE